MISPPVSVLIVSDDSQFSSAIRFLLGQQDDIEVIGTVANTEALTETVETKQPDVILIAQGVTVASVVNWVQSVQRIQQEFVTIALIDWIDDATVLLEAGIDIYVVKNEAPTLLLAILRRLTYRLRRGASRSSIEMIVALFDDIEVERQAVKELLDLDKQIAGLIIDLATTQGLGQSIRVDVQLRQGEDINYGYLSGTKIRKLIHHADADSLKPLADAMVEGHQAIMILAGQERVDQLLPVLRPVSIKIQRYNISMSLGGPVIDD